LNRIIGKKQKNMKNERKDERDGKDERMKGKG
jgi:hypothetical protein